MRFDFSAVEDVDSYVSVPPGTYECKVVEVRERHARDGSIRWSFRLEVLGGDYAGRTAAWDSITWSERGVHRVKHVLQSFGLVVDGVVEIEEQDLIGLRAVAEIQHEEREDPTSGRRQLRTRVPYMGYAPAPGQANGSEEGSRERPRAGEKTPEEPDGAQAQSLVDGWGVQEE